MKSVQRIFSAAILASACAFFSSASAQVVPTTNPSDVPAGVCPAIGSGAMPAAGVATVAGANPAISPDSACPVASSTTQPSEVGTLTVHAVQKTPGAGVAAADAVNIQFMVRGQLLDHMDTHLSGTGALDIPGLPIRFGLTPIVHVTHAGTVFTAIGTEMDSQHSTQSLDVPVYETTDQMPQWTISMRHIIIHPLADSVEVTEMLSVQSAGDRAWIGTPDAKGNRTTLSLALPAGAKQLSIGGAFDGASVAVVDGKLTTKQPMVPGEERYQLRYVVPAVDDKATLTITAPANVGHMMVFVPDDGTVIDAPPTLQSMGTQQLGDKGPKTRCFIAMSILPGQTLAIGLSGLKAAAAATPVSSADPASPGDPAPAASAADAAPAADLASSVQTVASVDAPKPIADHSIVPKVIAVGGGAAILLAGTAVVLFKGPDAAAVQKKQR